MPDLTLLLDLDPVAGMARIGSRRLDAFERMGLAFHERVRDGYLEIARAEKRRRRGDSMRASTPPPCTQP